MGFQLYEYREFIEIQYNSEKTLKFYYIWLRDHCRCSQCYNTKTHQISSNILNIPINIKPSKVEIIEDNLYITWEDKHQTTYSLPSLEKTDFPLISKREIVLWNKNNVSHFQDVKIPSKIYFENEDGPKKLLHSLLKYGFGLVTDVEPTLEATQMVAEKIAPVQKTYFGEMWSVSNDYQFSDTAYTNVALGAHTDNTYFTEAAGLQIFHMLSREGTGGETLLVDGFNVATNLKNRDKDDFEFLCKYSIESQYIEEGNHFSNIEPVIKLHTITKQLLQVRYNRYDRAMLQCIPQEKILQFYKAYKSFGNEVCNPINEWWLKLQPGSVLFIDNFRVLHGRAAYTGQRNLCGCYLSRVEWLSKARTLGLNIL
ncbi:hypothetical protein ILUMI_12880 [Ignelater luminosus]|uniref:Trimethyllysine dioxygenase, mitochondrial n=1 Tax=Ignelater luminosus TaxID=2038154 RepID=A0A8K0G957_IGNLU|nr:hypothetical protein ILUMI_12880 [Ignelater luminosus]